MATLVVDNYAISAPLIEIIYKARSIISNGKLKDVKETSKDIVVTCPNDEHDGGMEHNPDCHINICDDKSVSAPYGWCHCFACGLSCSFVEFIAHVFSSSIAYAKKWLTSNFGELIQVSSRRSELEIESPFKKTTKKMLDESVLNDYQMWSPYLAKRKLNRDICEKFKVRYDPYYRQIIFPVYDMHDNLKMLARRSIDTKVFHMDKGVEKEVYALNIIQKNNVKAAIITEGPFDCLTGWVYGVPTVATLGAISDYQIDQLGKSCLNVIYAMFDNDAAGRAFTEKLKTRLNKRILVIDVKIPNGFKDLNDLDYETFKKIYENASNF